MEFFIERPQIQP